MLQILKQNPRLPAECGEIRVGVVGARGYVGRELARLIEQHPALSLVFASSNRLAGQPAIGATAGAASPLVYAPSDPARLADQRLDVVVLALPDGASGAYLETLTETERPPRLIVDLSADHRFDAAWVYGAPEMNESQLARATRIANPGCYATAMCLALRPLVGRFTAVAHCFGVSGYSGAGATPCERNDAAALRNTILPYALVGHGHEREVGQHLNAPVRFAPSVAEFFRGIVLTAMVELDEPIEQVDVYSLYEKTYRDCPYVHFLGERTPHLGDVVGGPAAHIGGVCVDERDGRRVGVVCVLDNLLKGAASQAIQNINLALELAPTKGLTP